jgi:hypothetical protein
MVRRLKGDAHLPWQGLGCGENVSIFTAYALVKII